MFCSLGKKKPDAKQPCTIYEIRSQDPAPAGNPWAVTILMVLAQKNLPQPLPFAATSLLLRPAPPCLGDPAQRLAGKHQGTASGNTSSDVCLCELLCIFSSFPLPPDDLPSEIFFFPKNTFSLLELGANLRCVLAEP